MLNCIAFKTRQHLILCSKQGKPELLNQMKIVMKTHYFIALICLAISAGACKDKPAEIACDIAIAEGTRFFEFAHRGSEYTFYAWTNKPTVIANVEAQLALPAEDRSQHINGVIKEMPEGCELNEEWSWYFEPTEWDMADLSIELCDGNPQYVEENLQDYLDIDRYCPWSSYVLQEVAQPF